MSSPLLVAAGLAAGLALQSLHRHFLILFWPRVGEAVFALALLALSAGAAAAAFLDKRDGGKGGGFERSPGSALLCIGAGVFAGVVTFGGGQRTEVREGPGEGRVVSVAGGLRENFVPTATAVDLAIPLPEPPDGSLDLLSLGYPAGDVLALFMRLRDERGRGGASLTIVETDGRLLALAGSLRPDTAGAERDGTLRVVAGNPRWFLRRADMLFDVIFLSYAPSTAAYLDGALAFVESRLYTVEAFREMLDLLETGGFLWTRRPGTARVFSTLREAAAGAPGPPFAGQVVVLGNEGVLVSECFFRPRGFGGDDLRSVNEHSVGKGVEILYSPETTRRWNLYFGLARDEKVKGLYFTSPRDLSPVTDRRPFFEHFERVRISPHGGPLYEERGQPGDEWKLEFIPSADGVWWRVLAAALLLGPLVIGLPIALYHHRTGLARHAAAATGPLLLLGLATAGAFRSVTAWTVPLDPFPRLEGWAGAVFIASSGAGWLAGGRGTKTWRKNAAAAAALSLVLGAGGYHAGGVAAAAGSVAWIAFAFALAAVSGFAAGAAAGPCLAAVAGAFPGSEPFLVSTGMLGLASGAAAAALLAVHFGYPALWLVVAAAFLAAARAGRSL